MRRTLICLSLLSLILAACSDDDGNQDSGTSDLKKYGDQGIDASLCKSCPTGQTCKVVNKTPKCVPLDAGPDTGIPDAAKAASICGWMANEQGIKLTGVGIIACNEHECHSATSSSTGSFCIYADVAADYVVHVKESKINGKHYGDLFFPITITKADISANKNFDVGKVVLPVIGKTVALDVKNGGTMDLGSGVILKVPSGSAKLPPLESKADVGAAKIDKTIIHARLLAAQPAGKTAEVVYLLVPAELTFKTPATLEITGSGVTAGTKLDIYHVAPETGKLSKHGEAEVDSSGKLATTSGKGLTETGWLFFYKQ